MLLTGPRAPYATQVFCAAFPQTAEVCKKIYDRLCQRNKSLLRAIMKLNAPEAGDVLQRVSARAVCSIDWPAALKPLNEVDMANVFAATLPRRGAGLEGRILSFRYLDMALIVVDDLDEDRYKVYPASLCAMVMHKFSPQR